MHFIPVLAPFFPMLGVIAIEAVIVFALTTEAKYCSRPFIYGLFSMGLTMISLLMASTAKYREIVLFWNMLLLISRCALVPCWFAMSLEASGVKFFSMTANKALLITGIPILVFAVIVFTNPMHHWYWTEISFSGMVMTTKGSALAAVNTIYTHVFLVLASIIFFMSILRHFGNERKRLIALFVAVMCMCIGDELFRNDIALPLNVHPLSFFMVGGFCLITVSALRYGFPRGRAPITEQEIKVIARQDFPLPPEPVPEKKVRRTASPSSGDIFVDIPELSARQKKIALLVAEGHTYKVIAEREKLSERTVKYHMEQILDKCNLETREQLLVWLGERKGLISSHENRDAQEQSTNP